MKEQLITFETAKLAKEKGFPNINIGINNMYTEEGHFYNSVGPTFDEMDSYQAPTQPLLQKWLREKHNMHCIVSPVMGDKNGYDSYPLIGWRCDVIGLSKNCTNSYYMGYPILDWFTAESLEEGETLEELNIDREDIYEEALEKGLQEALKLI